MHLAPLTLFCARARLLASWPTDLSTRTDKRTWCPKRALRRRVPESASSEGRIRSSSDAQQDGAGRGIGWGEGLRGRGLGVMRRGEGQGLEGVLGPAVGSFPNTRSAPPCICANRLHGSAARVLWITHSSTCNQIQNYGASLCNESLMCAALSPNSPYRISFFLPHASAFIA